MAKKKKRKLSAWQKHVKSYMASHPGLSFKEALPKAKLTYRKGKSPNPRPSKKARKVKKKMAKKKTRRSRQMTIPLAPIAGLIAGLGEPAMLAMDGDTDGALEVVVRNYTGYSLRHKAWDFGYLQSGLAPLILGALVHKFIGGPPLNINRMLAAARVPLIRI